MEVILLLSVVGMAIADPCSTCSPNSSTDVRYSFVSNLLLASGFSDTCVAAALNACAPVPTPAPALVESQVSSLMEGARELLQEVSRAINKSVNQPHHCKDLLDSGDNGNGLRQVYPFPGQPHHHVTVYCDHDTDGGGWTVFQRRTNATAREDFYRTWIEYKLGFGNLEGEFWLGLDFLHALTSTTLQELRIDLEDYEGGQRLAKYGFFNVGTPETNYRLSVGRYSGDAGDSMVDGGHHGSGFSTHDADHDIDKRNCAQQFRGAWWYSKCHFSNLNGYQYVGTQESFADGINWRTWRGYHYSLRKTTMMIRPVF